MRRSCVHLALSVYIGYSLGYIDLIWKSKGRCCFVCRKITPKFWLSLSLEYYSNISILDFLHTHVTVLQYPCASLLNLLLTLPFTKYKVHSTASSKERESQLIRDVVSPQSFYTLIFVMLKKRELWGEKACYMRLLVCWFCGKWFV